MSWLEDWRFTVDPRPQKKNWRIGGSKRDLRDACIFFFNDKGCSCLTLKG